MERPTIWYGLVFPSIAFALAWAQFSPYWGFGGTYNHRLMWGFVGGVVASGLDFLLRHRIVNLILRRLARRDRVPPAA